MSIKTNKGLLPIDGDLVSSTRRARLSILDISGTHAWIAETLQITTPTRSIARSSLRVSWMTLSLRLLTLYFDSMTLWRFENL